MPREDVTVRLRELRTGRGLTQAQAADRIGCTGAQWGNWERGVSSPSLDELVLIAHAFSISLDWLLLGAGAETPAAHDQTIQRRLARSADIQRVLDGVLDAQRKLIRAVQVLSNEIDGTEGGDHAA